MSHRIHLTREGIYYLFVLLFVIGGAVFREVNLLLVISAAMIGPIVFSWRLVAAALHGLEVRRAAPATVVAGTFAPVEVCVTNHRRRTATWALEWCDTIDAGTPGAAEPPSIARVMLPKIPAGASETARYRLQPTRRGRLRIGPATATTRFPWGFVAGQWIDPTVTEILVTPRYGKLTARWAQVVNLSHSGSQQADRSRLTGQRRGFADGDYYGLRDWRPGDSRRWIHWRTSARLGGMAVLQFEQRQNRDVELIVDLWLPPQATAEQLANVERAVSFAATGIVDICRRSAGQLRVTLAGDEEQVWDRTASAIFAQELVEQLAEVRAGAGATELTRPATADSARAPKHAGSQVVVISTRPAPDSQSLTGDPGGPFEWIDVSSPRLKEFFQ